MFWCFSEKKKKKKKKKQGSGDMGGMGYLALPRSEPLPHIPPYKNKNGKNQPFLAFYIFAPHPNPTTPNPTITKKKIIWCSYWKKGLCTLENSWDLAMDFDSRQINLSVFFFFFFFFEGCQHLVVLWLIFFPHLEK